MYEYNSDKILQRQKVCMKCHSYVTHEKIDDQNFSCPLCGHRLPPTPNYSKQLPLAESKKYINEFYEKAYATLKSKIKK